MKKKSLVLGIILLSLGMSVTACNSSKESNKPVSSEQEVVKEGKRISK